MKYLYLIYGNAENWGHPIFMRHPEYLALPEEERTRIAEVADRQFREIEKTGELISGTALADPVLTRTTRPRDGVPVSTDGPYMESKEQLAGFFVFDCETPERADEIAAMFPEARFGAIEVHPIMDLSGQEM
ncbi:YciI family protein [Actinomadura roseirufa]|uniref:YciI family protein n=1 Tax=Actinomadura roseirufa TaxID=2094049 RepID=UPI001040F64F|nr:YciI family protein [Actinomadura roseirufa]